MIVGMNLTKALTTIQGSRKLREGEGDMGQWPHHQILTDQITLFQLLEVDYAHHIPASPPPLCFQWGFTRTLPGNQDVAMK